MKRMYLRLSWAASSLCLAIVSNSCAETRKPELSYGGHRTAKELKLGYYSSWINHFGRTKCGFDQWSWIETTTYITGIPATNAICGSGHGYNYTYITKVCASGFTPDNKDNPSLCTKPDDVPDLGKENGEPDTPQACGVAAGHSKSAGNPINFAVGNKFQREVDYRASGKLPLTFERTYNSHDKLWRHNYSAHLVLAPDNILFIDNDGKESYFQLENGVATAQPNELGKLYMEDGNWTYKGPTKEVFSFDGKGNLVKWGNTASGFHTLVRSNALTITITDSLGNSIVVQEDARRRGQPSSLVTSGSRIDFQYDSSDRLMKRITTIQGQAQQRTYHYQDSRNPNLLTGITDERGIRYATWTYDDQGRAISSEHAGGAERTLVSYNDDGSSTVTNALGKRTTYRFQTIQGVRRVTAIEGEPSANCPNSNSTFTYDDRGLVKTRTDNKGNVTTFDYNERGLEISRTEAYGTAQARTVTTTWYPTLFLPASVTEPDRITTYSYDDQGRPLSQVVTPH